MSLNANRLGDTIANAMKGLKTQEQFTGHPAPYTDDETAAWHTFSQVQPWRAIAQCIVAEITANASLTITGTASSVTAGVDTAPVTGTGTIT